MPSSSANQPEWDLYDDDPWGEWDDLRVPGARESMSNAVRTHMLGGHKDDTWAEEDEPRYVAALLYAGAEPEDAYHFEHGQWQDRVAHVLMAKHHKCWWWEWCQRDDGDPQYRQKAQTWRWGVQLDELRKFYTWVCKQRREAWTDNLVPAPKTGLLPPY